MDYSIIEVGASQLQQAALNVAKGDLTKKYNEHKKAKDGASGVSDWTAWLHSRARRRKVDFLLPGGIARALAHDRRGAAGVASKLDGDGGGDAPARDCNNDANGDDDDDDEAAAGHGSNVANNSRVPEHVPDLAPAAACKIQGPLSRT